MISSRPAYALDSNALIHALKGAGRVRERLVLVEPGSIGLPAIMVYEIEYGTLRSANPDLRRSEMHRLPGRIEVLPFDRAAAERTALVRSRLERSGQTIGPLNLLIAGTALAFGCRLVTHNRDEFARVEGLDTEDWF